MGGASTREIYEAVLSGLSSENRRVTWSNVDSELLESDVQKELKTPMTMAEKPLNCNTFRSYLARFKDEGRIFFNEETRRWRVTEQEMTTVDNYDEKDRDGN